MDSPRPDRTATIVDVATAFGPRRALPSGLPVGRRVEPGLIRIRKGVLRDGELRVRNRMTVGRAVDGRDNTCLVREATGLPWRPVVGEPRGA
jgi:hypothetical protein